MQLPPFELERYFAKYEFSVQHLLCCSDCQSVAVQDLLALEPDAPQRLQQLWLGYTEAEGSLPLRRQIAGLYASIAPEQVLVHSGAEEAIFLFMLAQLHAGDHVIVHSPCYQSLAEVARSIGCQVTPWLADEQHDWALDPTDFKRLLKPNTRALILNTPHNPTGYLMDHEVFLEINRLAQAAGVVLFSDEVYRELEHNPADRLPAACDINPLAVSLGVMSKAYGLAGLRIGWIATHNATLRQRMAGLKDYTTICNSAPSELLAEIGLRHRHRLLERNLGIIRTNFQILDSFFARYPDRFVWRRPRAGPIAFPRLLGEEVAGFCDKLVRQAGVLLLPGTVYGDTGNHFRIGFGRRSLGQALSKLGEYMGGRP